jgi:transcriptional regulator with PAS, ATPase and Fis domain
MGRGRGRGCTAIGASLQSGLPVQVNWFETYSRNWHDWVNQAAPIHDPVTHHLLGALNVAGFREISHPGTLNVILQAVSLIEMAVLEQETRLRTAVLEQFNTLSTRYPTDGLIACDRRGYILAINPTAEKQLAFSRIRVIGQRVDTLRPLLDLLGPNASSLLDVPPQQRVLQHAVVVPVVVDRPAGVVVILSVPAVKQPDSLWTTRYTFADLIGEHPRFRECVDLAFKASRQDWPVLILGESGTGKELFAHAIHTAGPRRHAPFVVFTCAGISDELIGAELFGYTEGSFTGAARGGGVGKFRLADKGTLFLDDIDCMPPKMQSSLLRVLEDQRVLPLGGTKPQPVDVRVIASSNADLERACNEGRFRYDLYYRLHVLSLQVPPLRTRLSDIPVLVTHLLSQIAPGATITDEALALLSAYTWPGNVRELRNMLIRASMQAQHHEIRLNDLPEHLLQQRDMPAEPGGAPVSVRPLETSEREEILNALRESDTVLQAADKLGIHFTTLYRKLKKLGLSMSQAEPGVFGSGKSRLSSTRGIVGQKTGPRGSGG